ncbi:GNAT family N-acetyltransferase [Streptomyces lushanensis]|uniref:GNAT family N-acetyltransferase n=1 Tax=Streptomyces lushanensis TaxID=1434255 RepID=UPI00082F82E8
MSDLDIRDNRSEGRLEAYENGRAVGSIVYFAMEATAESSGALVAVHTGVEEGHEGKGIAGALVRELYATAGREGVPVVPFCPYAARWAQRHPAEAPAAPDDVVGSARELLKAALDSGQEGENGRDGEGGDGRAAGV